MAEPLLRLTWRPIHFHLPQAMVTAHGALAQRRGWLLRLESPDGRLGWGEALALEPEQGVLASALAGAIQALPPCLSRPPDRSRDRRSPQVPGLCPRGGPG